MGLPQAFNDDYVDILPLGRLISGGLTRPVSACNAPRGLCRTYADQQLPGDIPMALPDSGANGNGEMPTYVQWRDRNKTMSKQTYQQMIQNRFFRTYAEALQPRFT